MKEENVPENKPVNKPENEPEIAQELHERLCAYVFGELQGAERAEFERELMQSPALQAERVRLEATIGLVKRAIPDEGLSLAARRDVVASARRARFRFLSGRRLLSLAAACAFVLGGVLAVRLVAGRSAERDTPEVRVARQDRLERGRIDGMRTMEVVPETRAKAVGESQNEAQLEALGYGGAAEESSVAAEPEAPAELAQQLRGLGYSAGEPGISVDSLHEFSAGTQAPVYDAPGVAAVQTAAPEIEFGSFKLPAAGPTSPGPRTAGRATPPIQPTPATGAEGFFLGHGAKNEGSYRGPGDTRPPSRRNQAGSGADASAAALAPQLSDELRALGYVGAADERDDASGSRRQLTREEVAVQLERLLESTRVASGESPRDMFFRYWGDAPFVLAREEHTSTFAVDVDTASYALTRSYLNAGQLPPRAAIRTEEFVNYFKADQPPPSDGRPFAIGLELAPSLFARDARTELLRVTVRAKDVADFERQPVALTFVIDNSGSMSQGGRLELVKRSLGLLLRELYAGDSVAIVRFSNEASVVTRALPVVRRGELEALIQGLASDGGTNVEAGLRLGYELAQQNLARNTVNRVILCSDGVGNIGETSANGVLALVKDARAQGIYLNTVGVGMGNHNDAFLEQLANQGDGVCNYVDSDAEAKRVFVDGLASALQPVARDVKVQVELDPDQVESWRLLGYENRALENRHFRDDAIDAGEVNAGHQVSALYELVRHPGRSGPLATVRLRYKPPFAIDQGREGRVGKAEAEQALELERTLGSVEARPGFAGTSGGYQRAVLVAQLAEVLRDSVHARGDSLATLVQEARRLAATLDDPDFTEFVALLTKANPLLDARAKQAPPKVQGLLDELALAQFELARGTRMRMLETDAAASEQDLERRLGVLRSGQSGDDARERELRERVQRLEREIEAEVGLTLEPDVQRLESLGYTRDE
jgi:Ca-activated chloride channel family protein